MVLSRLAQQFAAEIHLQDWSDAPYRADRAGHNRSMDRGHATPALPDEETDRIRMNVMWVTAQVLAYNDPNFNVYEFAEACGVNIHTRRGHLDGGIAAGLREWGGGLHHPGTYEPGLG